MEQKATDLLQRSTHKRPSYILMSSIFSPQDLAAKLYGYRRGDNSGLGKNLLQVNVYFSTLNINRVTESVTYSTNTMIYAFGGAMSLYLGISLVMVFEVIEWLIDTLLNLVCQKQGKQIMH